MVWDKSILRDEKCWYTNYSIKIQYWGLTEVEEMGVFREINGKRRLDRERNVDSRKVCIKQV